MNGIDFHHRNVNAEKGVQTQGIERRWVGTKMLLRGVGVPGPQLQRNSDQVAWFTLVDNHPDGACHVVLEYAGSSLDNWPVVGSCASRAHNRVRARDSARLALQDTSSSSSNSMS